MTSDRHMHTIPDILAASLIISPSSPEPGARRGREDSFTREQSEFDL